jgi:hypothetical protein
MPIEYSFISFSQIWDALKSAGCSYITHNKKVFRIFLIGLIMVSFSISAITHDATKGVNFYLKGIEYVFRPEIEGMLKKAKWLAIELPPLIQKHLSISYTIEKGPHIQIH